MAEETDERVQAGIDGIDADADGKADAAETPAADGGSGSGGGDERGGKGSRRRAVVAGVAAVAIVAGIGAAAWLWPKADAPQGQGQQEQQSEAQQGDELGLDVRDVWGICRDLSLDGVDCGVERDSIRVVANAGRIMVVHTSDEDPADMVGLAARRCAALAGAVEGMRIGGAQVEEVVWVVADGSGLVKVVVSNVPGRQPQGGGEAELVGGSHAHAIADDVWGHVSDKGFAQSAGGAIEDPYGDPVEVDQPAPEDEGETEPEDEGGPDGSEAAGGGRPSSPDGGSDGSGTASGSSSSGSSGSSGSGSSGNPGSSPSGSGNSGSGSGSGSGGSSSSESGGGSTAPACEHNWVEQGSYQNVWEEDIDYIRHTVYTCNGCGAQFSSKDSWAKHCNDKIMAGDDSHGTFTDDSWTEKVDNGKWVSKWVSAGYSKCSKCGATK